MLDARILEFHIQGKDIGYNGKDLVTAEPAPPQAVVQADAPKNPLEAADGRVVVPIEGPNLDAGKSKTSLWLLIGSLCGFSVVLMVVGVAAVLLRARRRAEPPDAWPGRSTNSAMNRPGKTR